MQLFYLSLGSNIGERCSVIDRAVAMMDGRLGRVVARSSMYESVADGFVSENTFVNAVVVVESEIDPYEVLHLAHGIEVELGCTTHRNADGSYCDRLIDIDVIACDDMVSDDEVLTLPHPRMHLRAFVLDPLCEVAPQWVHPQLHKTAEELRNLLHNPSV